MGREKLAELRELARFWGGLVRIPKFCFMEATSREIGKAKRGEMRKHFLQLSFSFRVNNDHPFFPLKKRHWAKIK